MNIETMLKDSQIHPSADVASNSIGEGTKVWQFSVILEGAIIGKNCNINCHTFIENDVIIGDNVTIKAGVYIWDGIEIGDNVFIGPNVTFVNDTTPRSKVYPPAFKKIKIGFNASVGANATILGDVELGKHCMVGASALVTKSVPDYALVIGSPAQIVGWVNEKGERISENEAIRLKNI